MPYCLLKITKYVVHCLQLKVIPLAVLGTQVFKLHMWNPLYLANLVNGNNFTCDDLQVWLAPYFKNTAGSKDEKRNGPLLSIEISMSNPVTVAMIRLFNYNKSRTHSVRGVRHFQLLVDGVPVYSG
jgi:hypothetical protein